MTTPRTDPVPLWNIANILTMIRCVMVPVFIVLAALYPEDFAGRILVAAIFVVAMITDFLDGYLARSRNLITDFGKIVDPIADKGMTGAAFVMLSVWDYVPWWMTILILVREFGITVFRFIALRDRVIAASIWGKIKTVVQAVAVSFALVPLWSLLGDWMHWVNTGLMTLAVLLTVGSGIEYLVEAARVGRAAKLAGPASNGDAASGAGAGTQPRA